MGRGSIFREIHPALFPFYTVFTPMLDEIRVLEPQLKQVLYGAVEHIQATKGALYLSTSHDLNVKTYELVTSYSYNAADRKIITAKDDMIDRLAVRRNIFVVNGLGADQRFAEMQFRQGTDRLLVAPLFSRGRLIGFIDLRDKAGKKPFENPDIEAARRLSEEMLKVLGQNQLFGLGPISLVEDPTQQRSSGMPQVMPRGASGAPAPPPAAVRSQNFSPQAITVIEASREFVTKRLGATYTGKRKIADADLEVVRLLLPAALAIPGAAFATISAPGHMHKPQTIVSIAAIADDALAMLVQHLAPWMADNNERINALVPRTAYPFGAQAGSVTAAAVSAMLSAPVNPGSAEGLMLTVAFERIAEEQAKRALDIFIGQIEESVESALAATSGLSDRQIIAERLLEPDFQKYPDLVEHSRYVSTLSHRFAKLLQLSSAQVEITRLAAIVHDVGLRLLDYDRVAKRVNLTAEEMRTLAEHPIVGAAIVEPFLGSEVAQAVLRHHERFDGRGYPSRLSGQAIPLASRIIQICDAWIAMTGQSSYKAPISHEEAAGRLREGAGAQFDDALVSKFLEALPELTA